MVLYFSFRKEHVFTSLLLKVKLKSNSYKKKKKLMCQRLFVVNMHSKGQWLIAVPCSRCYLLILSLSRSLSRADSFLYKREKDISRKCLFFIVTPESSTIFTCASDKQHIFRRTTAIARPRAIFLLKFLLLKFIPDITSSKAHMHILQKYSFEAKEYMYVLCV